MAAYNLGGLLGASAGGSEEVRKIPVTMLVPFHEHRFELYDGERKEDMMESIRRNGIFQPILVQPINDGEEYEILAGHNRWNCAKEAGLDKVPCIIKYGLDEATQKIYVDESNVLQRGFDNLKVSERARVLKERYDDMFSQGKRNDIIAELEAYENNEKPAGGRSGAKLGKEYGLGKTSVARYIRLAKLKNKNIIGWLDNGDISIRAGVELSYLSENEQYMVACMVDAPKKQLSEKKSKLLKDAAAGRELDEEIIDEIINAPKKEKSKAKEKEICIPDYILTRYFLAEDGQIMSEDRVIEYLTEVFEYFNFELPKLIKENDELRNRVRE